MLGEHEKRFSNFSSVLQTSLPGTVSLKAQKHGKAIFKTFIK
jgi:hypothetical protein